MRIEDFKLFIAVDDNDTELFLTKAIFQDRYPTALFRCESEAGRVVSHIRWAASAGIRPEQVCILLDIKMPRTNGFEVIYNLRNDIDSHACCILMLSASQTHADRDDAKAIGADGFVPKPFDIRKLEDVLALNRRERPTA